jgi:penicillin-binding protein 1C
VTLQGVKGAVFCFALPTSCAGKSAKRVFAQTTRASTPFFAASKEDADGRDKPGHDDYNHAG